MSDISLFQIDAFADRPFSGNPAAVCLMEQPANDLWLQNVAAEMNLSETAFVWRLEDRFHLRWFTPTTEVDLCGHATLASSHALWESGWLAEGETAQFDTRSGLLTAIQDNGSIFLDFPSQPPLQCDAPDNLVASLGVNPEFVGRNEADYLVHVKSESVVRNATIDFALLATVGAVRGAILTAPSETDDYDFVSRFFAPAYGIDEDPVTGSAHCCLAPYWANIFGRARLTGYQASSRGGRVETHLAGDRVKLGGQALTVFRGSLQV